MSHPAEVSRPTSDEPAVDASEPKGSPQTEGQSARQQRLTVWIALIVALVGLLQAGTPPRVAMLCLIAVAAVLSLSIRWRVGPIALLTLLVVGLALRIGAGSGFSDVLNVSQAATREMLAGGNPYGHGFEESFPPGAPFAYGPVALLWYLPRLDDPKSMELLAASAMLVALAVRGRPIGLAVYAVTPALVVVSSDGSNDTSAGLLILLSLLTAVRWPTGGGALLAVAVAFKPYALAWLPGLIAYAGTIWPLLAFIIVSLITWGPALVAWGPSSMISSFQQANGLHQAAYYSLAFGLDTQAISKDAYQLIRLAAGLALAVLSFVLVRSATSFIIMGVLVFLATLFLGFWATFSYVSAIAPIVCWHLDDWLGLGQGRVIWPGDPVRAVTVWVDARWPVRSPGPAVIESSPISA